jgi:hypothetical protein
MTLIPIKESVSRAWEHSRRDLGKAQHAPVFKINRRAFQGRAAKQLLRVFHEVLIDWGVEGDVDAECFFSSSTRSAGLLR